MKRVSVMLVLAVCLVGITGQARAQATDTITVTVSLEAAISVSVLPDAWTIGPITISGSNGPESFTATVGNSATKLEIMGSDGAGGWAIGATVDADQFVVAVTDPAITLTALYQTLEASVAAYGNKAFDLTYSAPDSDTQGGGVDQGFTITLRASAP